MYAQNRWNRLIRLQYYKFIQRIHGRYKRMTNAARRPRNFLRALVRGDQIQLAFSILLVTVTIGTSGYMLLMDWTVVDSFYMTVITLTTVGFGEVTPMDTGARVFTILLILSGVSIIAYGISGAVEDVISGRLLERLEEKNRQIMLLSLKNHYIIVGFGRVGQEVAYAFKHENMPFVVVDVHEEAIHMATESGYLALHGSATEDETLVEAGIENAKGLVSATGDNATNIYVVLSARGLNEELFIIARASDENAEVKLQRAGANRVISPYILGGRRMANLAVRPHVVDFLDITSQSDLIEQALEEIDIEENSVLAGKTIGEIDLRRRTGANILAIYSAGGELLSNPTAATILDPGTRLILLGTRDQLDVTEALARDFMRLVEKSGEE